MINEVNLIKNIGYVSSDLDDYSKTERVFSCMTDFLIFSMPGIVNYEAIDALQNLMERLKLLDQQTFILFIMAGICHLTSRHSHVK